MKNTKMSNDLRYTTTKIVGDELITVKISLNDECKNGHQDFAITGDIYKAGKPRTDRYYISGGCIHDTIAKHFPQFVPFIKLHLCDYKGIPMHARANGFYRLRNGFNNCPPENPKFPATYCKYYRITPDQFTALATCENEIQYGVMVMKLGILDKWKNEADQAILELERLTEKKFVVDSDRNHWIPPTQSQIEEEEKKQREGYYTPQAAAQREEQKKQAELDKLTADFQSDLQNEISKHTLGYEVEKEVLIKGGSKALKNCIFYNHTKELAFNWMSWDKLPVDFINELIPRLVLPEGVSAKIATDK